MLGFRWVDWLREIGCSDLCRENKYVHIKNLFVQEFFVYSVYLVIGE